MHLDRMIFNTQVYSAVLPFPNEYLIYLAKVNIGILRSILHHVQCINSQQLFYYIISLKKQTKKKQQLQQNLGYGLCLGQS